MKDKSQNQKHLYTNSRAVKSNLTEDSSVNRWYRLIMGFNATLVNYLIDSLSIEKHHLVLDPFCGSGTTLVECKKKGIPSLGIDANPVCVFASQVKTNWRISPASVTALAPALISRAKSLLDHNNISQHPTFRQLSDSGMIDRGWISAHKAKKLISLLSAIDTICTSQAHKDFFRLALVSATVRQIADIKFGPELYCLRRPKRLHVFPSFLKMTNSMIDDLASVRGQENLTTESRVFLADSRNCAKLLSSRRVGLADFIITSPPYPNEHDYTRSTRLELVLLGHIRSNKNLQQLKRSMIRCHTKGIYAGDNEQSLTEEFKQVRKVALRLEKKAANRSDGFSRLYAKMIGEYFGGMTAHLISAYRSLKPRGMCAYVVCDQQSLLGVYIDTPEILKKIATSDAVGFKLVDAIKWKEGRGTTGNRILTEKILIFTKSDK